VALGHVHCQGHQEAGGFPLDMSGCVTDYGCKVQAVLEKHAMAEHWAETHVEQVVLSSIHGFEERDALKP
jgi:hypothetical protein